MNERKTYREVDEWLGRLAVAEGAAEGPEGPSQVEFIIEELFMQLNLQVFQRDNAGNLVFNDKGRAKLNWINIITGVFKIVAKVIVLANLYKAKRLIVK